MTERLAGLPFRDNVRCTRVATKRHFEQEYDEFLFIDSIYPSVSFKRQKSDRKIKLKDDDRRESVPTIQKKRQSFLVKGKEMRSFFNLLEDEVIQDFLKTDKCMRISDKYLIAMVFAYFKRAGFKTREFSRMNFFIALYLANDMEEDDEDIKYEIIPWALGKSWREKYPKFLLKRDRLWSKIDHCAVVSRRCCEEIMAIEPNHIVWQRNRTASHGGAIRNYMRSSDLGYPKGPNRSPVQCVTCETESQYDTTSPYTFFHYTYTGDIFSQENLDKTNGYQSSFDMKGLKKTLTEDEWPMVEE